MLSRSFVIFHAAQFMTQNMQIYCNLNFEAPIYCADISCLVLLLRLQEETQSIMHMSQESMQY